MEKSNAKGGMSVAEAGRRGGLKGGAAVRERYGPTFFGRIGKKGGKALKQERGEVFFQQIGRRGGEATKAGRGAEFFVAIGQKGGRKIRRLLEQARRAKVS